MAATAAAAAAGVTSMTATTPKATIIAYSTSSPKPHQVKFPLTTLLPCKRIVYARPVAAAPDQISEKVEESIKNAQETCSEDPVSGECAAAWDEVEELSAAASHARDKLKENSDPLENYCKDNPETDECKTYDD